jgi:methylmalonyl-CoA mutase
VSQPKEPLLTEWERAAQAELKGRAVSEFGHESPPGLHRKPLYTAEDLRDVSHPASPPGQFPFARGPYASMYLGRAWTLRQYAGFSTAEETNAFFRECLAAGQRGLSVAFDLATHRGYDSDHPRVSGDVGKAGVAVDSWQDMQRLFEGISLGETSVSMTMNGAVLPIFAMYLVVAEKQGIPFQELSGTLQNDILKEFLVRNTFIYPPEPSMRIVADVIQFASEHLPRYNPVSISGYHMHEAGAPADLELGFTLADGLEYVASARERGLSVDSFAPRLSFFFAVGTDLLIEVAKLRAARLLWARLLTERYGPARADSLRLRMHCQTSGVSLTAQDPYNNLIRTTIQALAAVLGGTQSLHTNGFDEALALPSDFAARLARNTQLILQHEVGLDRVIDPLGGSYCIETLTHQLAERAEGLVREVEARGGMTRAVTEGWPKTRILEAAINRQARIERGEQVIVGVNRFVAAKDTTPAVALRSVDNTVVFERQKARLAALRQERDAAAVAHCLARLSQAARQPRDNLVLHALAAARAGATVGEISQALEAVFGRYQTDTPGVAGGYGKHYAGDAVWQAQRARVLEFERNEGRRPRLLVAKLGQDGHDRGARLIATAFADGGFDVDVGPLFQIPMEVAQQAADNDVHIVGISTQAGAHLTLVPELLADLRRVGAEEALVICGGVIPEVDAERLRAAGVAAVFGPGTPVLDCIRLVLDLLESQQRAKNQVHDIARVG